VGPLISYVEADPSRKRHIGNDVIIIIFQDNDQQNLDLRSFTSKVNQIYLIVKRVVVGDETLYRVHILSKSNVGYFPPIIQEGQSLFTKKTVRKFLLQKLINGERYGLRNIPSFAQTQQKVRWNQMVTLFLNYEVECGFCNAFDEFVLR